MLPEAVSRYIHDHQPEHLAWLLALLRFASIANVTGEPDQCAPCAEWLADKLTSLGLEVKVAAAAGKPNVLAVAHVDDDAPTLLIYGHYDVQPPDPLDEWICDPFEPVVRDGWLYARGAADDKGQLAAHLAAIDAWQQAGGGLPVNVKLLLEGEEEIGSPNLEPFLADHADELAAEAAVISDSSFFADGLPSITYGLRGLSYVEITVTGPSVDLHSGRYGGEVANPINGLAAMIAACHDADGRVAIPGFYDDVVPLTDQERAAWRALPIDEAADAAAVGVRVLAGGERGLPPLERRWARPTLDANGIVGGYVGPGAKTIIPARASAKISMRLVPNQDPHAIARAFAEFVSAVTPPGLGADVQVRATARPVLLSTDTPAMAAGRAAMAEAFGREPAMIRCGASVPAVELIQRLLGTEAVLLGFSLPDDNVHAPNERFGLDQFRRGAIAAAAFMGNLADKSA